MARDEKGREGGDVVSVVGAGMRVDGDCSTDGTLRVEGRIRGSVRAGKAVVVGEDGVIEGDVETQDAVIAGRVEGSLVAESRLELKATCRVEADIRCRRVKLEEGGQVQGRLLMGEAEALRETGDSPHPSTSRTPGEAAGG